MVIPDEKVERELRRRLEDARLDGQASPFERLAPPLKRFGAFVIDYFVLAWPFVLLMVSPFVRQLKEAMLVDDQFSVHMHGIAITVVGALTLVFYQAIFHACAGATPGKFVFGLRVIPLWSQNERPTFWASLGRSCIWLLQFIFLAVPFLAVMADPNRRPWHDRMMNTVVVSVKRRGAIGRPHIYEIALVRVLTWAVVAVILSAGTALSIYQYKTIRNSYRFSQASAGGEYGCEAVDEALEDWPEERGEPPQRLSVAMALFATGDLDKSCLRPEAEVPSLGLTEQKSLAYLAKSFVYSDDQELSDKYLEEVCKIEEGSDECRLARVIEGMADEDADMIDRQFSEISTESRVYLSLWALRQYIRMQDFASAAKFLDKIPDHRSLAYFTVPSRAKVYWGLHRPQEARAAATAALDMLSGHDKLQFSSWLCFAEITRSCSEHMAQSCRVFLRMNDRVDDALADFQPALTKLKLGECDPAQEVSALTMVGMHPDVRQYAEALQPKSLADLYAFWTSADTRFELKDEAARHMLELTKERKYVDSIRSDWLKRTRGLGWEQLGKALFSHEVKAKNWVSAFAIGERLLTVFGRERNFSENFVVSAFYAGETAKARVTLKNMNGSVASMYESDEDVVKHVREPASMNNAEFLKVRHQLMNKERARK